MFAEGCGVVDMVVCLALVPADATGEASGERAGEACMEA